MFKKVRKRLKYKKAKDIRNVKKIKIFRDPFIVFPKVVSTKWCHLYLKIQFYDRIHSHSYIVLVVTITFTFDTVGPLMSHLYSRACRYRLFKNILMKQKSIVPTIKTFKSRPRTELTLVFCIASSIF